MSAASRTSSLTRRWARRLLALLDEPLIRIRRTRTMRQSARGSIDTSKRWRRRRSTVTILEILSYAGAIALIVVVVWAFVVMLLGPGILTSLNERCNRYSAACGADVGFLIPLLSVALASAIFLFYRLRHVAVARSRGRAAGSRDARYVTERARGIRIRGIRINCARCGHGDRDQHAARPCPGPRGQADPIRRPFHRTSAGLIRARRSTATSGQFVTFSSSLPLGPGTTSRSSTCMLPRWKSTASSTSPGTRRSREVSQSAGTISAAETSAPSTRRNWGWSSASAMRFESSPTVPPAA